jgi:hypothetical protein
MTEMTEQTNYWISKKNCYWNSAWNAKHLNIKGNKARYGCIYYQGKCLYGNDGDFNLFETIPTRKFHYGCGHTWTETKDGEIIDWVVNDVLKIPSSQQIVFKKSELEEKGFEWKYYENEKAIKTKTEKMFGCNCKQEAKVEGGECRVIWAKNYWKTGGL